MFVNSVQLKNYKCFGKSQKVSFSTPDSKNKGIGLNVLIGRNNKGKTAGISSVTKLKDDALIYNEEKNNKKDVEIIFQSGDETQIIKNIPNSGNINQEVKYTNFPITFNSNIHYIKENKIWRISCYETTSYSC